MADLIWGPHWDASDTRIKAFASTRTKIIAGTDAGILISTNTAQSWHPAAIHNPGGARITSIVHLNNRIFAGTFEGLHAPIWEMAADAKFAITGAGGGIFYSTDRARTWTRATSGLPATSAGTAFFISSDLVLAAVPQKPDSCAESKINLGGK